MFQFTHHWRRKRYALYAAPYDVLAIPYTAARRRAAEVAAVSSHHRVLVIGAGTGLDLEWLPPAATVHVVDVSRTMLRRAGKRAERLGAATFATVMDAGSLGYPDSVFDRVILHLVLTVVPNPEDVIAESCRVVRPDGLVSIMDKFIPDATRPTACRVAANAVISFVLSDITLRLQPLAAGAGLRVRMRERYLWGHCDVVLLEPV